MIIQDIDTVARTAWGEGRGAGFEGMHAIVNVISNRANNPRWWGKDWISVCRQPSQFSCWNDGDPNLPKLLAVTDSDPEFRVALSLAKAAVEGTLPDITGNADHFYANGTPAPYWAKSGTQVYADASHTFFRLELPAPQPVETPAPEVVPPSVESKPKSPLNSQINQATTQGTAGLAAGAAGAITVLVSGALEHFGWLLTQEQGSALMLLLALILHPLGVKVFGDIRPAKPPAA